MSEQELREAEKAAYKKYERAGVAYRNARTGKSPRAVEKADLERLLKVLQDSRIEWIAASDALRAVKEATRVQSHP